jgi:hypothetical protein
MRLEELFTKWMRIYCNLIIISNPADQFVQPRTTFCTSESMSERIKQTKKPWLTSDCSLLPAPCSLFTVHCSLLREGFRIGRQARSKKQELRTTVHNIPNSNRAVLHDPPESFSPRAVEHGRSQSKMAIVWICMYCHILHFTLQAIGPVRSLHLVCPSSGNRQATMILTLQRLHIPECQSHNLQQW